MSQQEDSFISHLVELRDRVVRCLIAVGVVFGILCIFPGPGAIYDLLAMPLTQALPEGTKMVAIGVVTPFMVPIKVTMLVAFVIALPVVLFQVWGFVAPGLYAHEKRLALPLVVASYLLFLMGVAFCYFLVFGKVFSFIQSFAPKSITAAPDIEAYLGFVLSMFLAFGLAFEALPALNREEVDLVISSDRVPPPGIVFNPLFDYHPTFVGSAQNPLAAKDFIAAEDFRDQVLITYPVGRDKLDVFTELLTPAQVEPRAQRTAELTAVILMLVGSNRGVAVLPDWVMREVKTNADYITRPLGPEVVTKRMYAATREEDAAKPYIAHFLRLARSEPVKLQRG